MNEMDEVLNAFAATDFQILPTAVELRDCFRITRAAHVDPRLGSIATDVPVWTFPKAFLLDDGANPQRVVAYRVKSAHYDEEAMRAVRAVFEQCSYVPPGVTATHELYSTRRDAQQKSSMRASERVVPHRKNGWHRRVVRNVVDRLASSPGGFDPRTDDAFLFAGMHHQAADRLTLHRMFLQYAHEHGPGMFDHLNTRVGEQMRTVYPSEVLAGQPDALVAVSYQGRTAFLERAVASVRPHLH